MLVKPVISSRPSKEISDKVTASQYARASASVYPIATIYPLPEWVDPDDYRPLNGGGYASKTPDSVEPDSSTMMFVSYTKDDPLVKVEWDFFFENIIVNGYSGSAGDGVTPFGLPPDADLHSFNVNYPALYSGDWKAATRLTYESGRTETVTDFYTVTGAQGYTEQELYIGGVPTPQYKEDWQTIADLWTGFGETQKANAAQALADAASPTPPPDDNALSLTNLPPTAEQSLQDTASLVSSSKTAHNEIITQFDSLAQTNIHTAVLYELNTLSSNVVQKWQSIANTATNPNLKKVAQANFIETKKMLDYSLDAHNKQSNEQLYYADENWSTYQDYAADMESKTANTLISFVEWVKL